MSEYTFVDPDNLSTDDDEDDKPTQTTLHATRKNQKQHKRAGQSTAKSIANARRRVDRKWTESEEDQLILSVQNRRLLYDCSDPEYKEKYAKKNAWKDVADELGIAGVRPEDAKNKWNYLRNNFKTQLGRYRARLSSGEDAISSNWSHFRSMMFVESAVAQSTASTSPLKWANAVTDQLILDDILPNSIKNNPRNPMVAQRRKRPAPKASTPSPSTSPSTSPTTSPTTSRTLSPEITKELADQVLAKLDERVQTAPNKYIAFTDNIARHMQSLDADSAFELEAIITRTMFDFMVAKRSELLQASSKRRVHKAVKNDSSTHLDIFSDEDIANNPKYRNNGRNGWLRKAKKHT